MGEKVQLAHQAAKKKSREEREIIIIIFILHRDKINLFGSMIVLLLE